MNLKPDFRIHFVGIGGIGMSGLAAMCADFGYIVSGSDRGADRPENRRIIDALELQGITIFPQDGSFIQSSRPDCLVYSTAIEEDNADFAAAAGIPRLHRSELLAMLLEENRFETTIAVSGSCGKSSVTAYLAEALTNLGADPSCLNGALSKRFRGGRFAGNYRSGSGKYFVFEADESDKSLVHYAPDYAILLNIGTDHYSREELARVFAQFLSRVRRGAVVERECWEAIQPFLPPGNPLKIAVFDAVPRPDSQWAVKHYCMEEQTSAVYRDGRRKSPETLRQFQDNFLSVIYGIPAEDCRLMNRVPVAEFTGNRSLALPQPGFHTALNALAVDAMLEEMLHFPTADALEALTRFDGLWRRNDLAGTTASGALVYDDYAHNPEKIISCLRAMRELCDGRIFAVFQPHGFKPFGFMRETLFEDLEKELKRNDRFLLLEPFYAGGTSSFTPTSREVADDWRSRARHPEHYESFPDRELLTDYLLTATKPGDLIVIMGARDNSLSDYAGSLCV